jgi:ABC-type lipoprotein export system ATPase subunit
MRSLAGGSWRLGGFIAAILGASGSGKSSLLRAGALPRLARDDRQFLALPIIRPERQAARSITMSARSRTSGRSTML